MNDCIYLNNHGFCMILSDWSKPKPVLQPCVESPCEYYKNTMNELKLQLAEQVTRSAKAELAESDVMRALECCSVYETCDGCPHFDGVPEDDCRYKAMANALALLREKDAEIKGLVEGWSEDQDRFEKVCDEKDAEIERLQNGLAISKKETRRYMTSYKQTRVEAITDFAKELDSELIKGGIYPVFVKEAIERTEKKLKGETK